MSCLHCGSILVSYTRGGWVADLFEPFYCNDKYFCHWIQFRENSTVCYLEQHFNVLRSISQQVSCKLPNKMKTSDIKRMLILFSFHQKHLLMLSLKALNTSHSTRKTQGINICQFPSKLTWLHNSPSSGLDVSRHFTSWKKLLNAKINIWPCYCQTDMGNL